MLSLTDSREQSDSYEVEENEEKPLTHRQKWYRNLPLEKKIQYRMNSLNRYRTMTVEEKKRYHARNATYMRNLPPSKKKAIRERHKKKHFHKREAKKRARLEELERKRKITPEIKKKRKKERKELTKILVQLDQIYYGPDIEQLLRSYHLHHKLKYKPKLKLKHQQTKEEKKDRAREDKMMKAMQARFKQFIEASNLVDHIAQLIYMEGSIRDTTLDICDRAMTEKVLLDKNTAVLVAACYYLACRKEGVVCRLRAICNAIGANFKSVNKSIKKLKGKIKIECSFVCADELATRFCQLLQLSHSFEEDSWLLARRLSHFENCRRWNPNIIAVVSIYLTAIWREFPLDFNELFRFAGGIGRSYFNMHFKQLMPHLNELFSDEVEKNREIKEEIIDTA